MESIGSTGLWLTVVVAAWAVVTARAGGARDPGLLRSGSRALHAAAVLMPVALVALVLDVRADAIAVRGDVPWSLLARDVLDGFAGTLLVLGALAAAAGAAIPAASAPALPGVRARANLTGGLVVGGVALAVLTTRAWWGGAGEGAASPVLFHWSGLAFLVTYLAGLGVAIVPAALAHAPALAPVRRRWTLVAIAFLVAALALGAWSRHGGAAPAPELDPAGALVDRRWTTAHLLLLVPLLMLAASVPPPGTRTAAAVPARSRTGSVLLLFAAAIVLSVFGPVMLDWSAGRELSLGKPLAPLPSWLGITVGIVAGVAALHGVLRAVRARVPQARLISVARASALATLSLAVISLSTRAERLPLSPGNPGVFAAAGHEWRFSSQGTSQEEEATYDGALVAFEITSGRTTRIESAGERVYRDAHGHPAARVAVPGLLHGITGDLRFTVRAMRGDEALLRVQFHPLAAFAWIAAGLTVASLAAAAGMRGETEVSEAT